MAHFYGDLQGSRGQATRVGTKKSGIEGHIRGWQVGARVRVSFNESTSEDEVEVQLTSGSNGNKPDVCLGRFTKADLDGLPSLDDVFSVLREMNDYIFDHQGQRAIALRQQIFIAQEILERIR